MGEATRAFFGSSLLVVCGGCSVQPVTRPATPFGSLAGPVIIAHRGGSLEAPENTAAAVRHGVAVGSDWQEIDVTLTRDGHVVVIHDDTVDRTTGAAGTVSEMTLAQLRALDAGKPGWSSSVAAQVQLFGGEVPDFGGRFAGEKIPTLEEILAIPGVRLMIELKEAPKERVKLLATKVVEAVRKHQLSERVVLGSFETDLLWAAHDLDPTIPILGIAESDTAIRDMLALPIMALAVRIDHIGTAREAAPPAVAVWAWTAYTPSMAQAAVEQGANGIITDAPAAVIAAIRVEPPTHVELP